MQQNVILREDLDFNASVPLYLQISSILQQKISNGALQIGDSLPPELSLCKDLNLSRSTIRKAFTQLEHEGKILRKQGIGTIVCEPKLRRNLNTLYNFSSEMVGLGIKPSSDVLKFEVTKPNPVIAQQLNIPETNSIYKICRLRKGDGKPLLLEKAYIPTIFLPYLTEEDLNDSLYAMITQYTGTFPAEATETYEAVVLTEREAKQLNCKPNTPAFRIQRVSKNSNGDIFEYTTIIAPGDRNKYEITLNKNDVIYKKVM